MNHKQAMEYIESLQGLGSIPGLVNITNLCERLGNPQNQLNFIHVAGTNGKGSVTAYLSEILIQAGFRIGRYVSPTILDYRERIQINGRLISKAALGRITGQVKEACDEMVLLGLPQPTAFEVETAMAFVYFLEKQCDIVILETGMGGRLDATNLIQNTKVAVFTSISMDHMAYLGDNLSKIASEKAGIIKKDCQVVTMEQEPEVMKVISDVCIEKNASLSVLAKKEITRIQYGLKKQSFFYGKYGKLTISLAGTCQVENAALAVRVADLLREEGMRIPEQAVIRGLLQTKWLGRFSVIGQKPLFVIDGAHNEDAAKRLADSIRFYFTNRKIIYIIGILKDKDYKKILSLTYAYADSIITVKTPGNARAMDACELAKEASVFHKKVTAADSLVEAVEMAYLLADKDSVILAFGSLSYLGDLVRIVQKQDNSNMKV